MNSQIQTNFSLLQFTFSEEQEKDIHERTTELQRRYPGWDKSQCKRVAIKDMLSGR